MKKNGLIITLSGISGAGKITFYKMCFNTTRQF